MSILYLTVILSTRTDIRCHLFITTYPGRLVLITISTLFNRNKVYVPLNWLLKYKKKSYIVVYVQVIKIYLVNQMDPMINSSSFSIR